MFLTFFLFAEPPASKKPLQCPPALAVLTTWLVATDRLVKNAAAARRWSRAMKMKTRTHHANSANHQETPCVASGAIRQTEQRSATFSDVVSRAAALQVSDSRANLCLLLVLIKSHKRSSSLTNSHIWVSHNWPESAAVATYFPQEPSQTQTQWILSFLFFLRRLQTASARRETWKRCTRNMLLSFHIKEESSFESTQASWEKINAFTFFYFLFQRIARPQPCWRRDASRQRGGRRLRVCLEKTRCFGFDCQTAPCVPDDYHRPNT